MPYNSYDIQVAKRLEIDRETDQLQNIFGCTVYLPSSDPALNGKTSDKQTELKIYQYHLHIIYIYVYPF